LVFSSFVCYAQGIAGSWERTLPGGRQIITFSENRLESMEIMPASGERQALIARIYYFAADNLLRFFDETGTGILIESMRFEYHLDGDSLVLSALNPGASVSLLEGRWTRVK